MPLPTILRKLVVAMMVAWMTTPCSADSWNIPSEATFTSANGTWRLVIAPRPLSSQLAYFENKSKRRSETGGKQADGGSASARMQQFVHGRWKEVWKGPLLNDVAPVDALVSDDGRAITFDNWHSMGYGDDTIVVYDPAGRVACQWGLDDLLPIVYVDHLPRSVSSRRWRGEVSLDPDSRHARVPVALPFVRPDTEEDAPTRTGDDTVTLGIDLYTCAIDPPEHDAWKRAFARALVAQEQSRAEAVRDTDIFRNPLVAPVVDDSAAWRRYLARVLERITESAGAHLEGDDIVWLDDATSIDLEDRLSEACGRSRAVIVGATSSHVLLEVTAKASADIPKGGLASMPLLVVADAPTFASAERLLGHTGARIIHVDPSVPIPQSAKNLAWFASMEAERASEREERLSRALKPRWWEDE